jgi:hypothetical protein
LYGLSVFRCAFDILPLRTLDEIVVSSLESSEKSTIGTVAFGFSSLMIRAMSSERLDPLESLESLDDYAVGFLDGVFEALGIGRPNETQFAYAVSLLSRRQRDVDGQPISAFPVSRPN